MTIGHGLARRVRTRGALLVVGLFVLGGFVLWGLFQAPRAVSPPAPAAVKWGVPSRPLRVASFNVQRLPQGMDTLVSEIRAVEPDFVLLQEVESRDVVGLAQALDMQQYHHPNHYDRSANLGGRKATWGNVVFAKHPLYDAGAIPNPGGGSFGVWMTAVADEKKFVIASINLSGPDTGPDTGREANSLPVKESEANRRNEIGSFLKAWRERGSPPVVVGGDFNPISSGKNIAVMTEPLVDALTTLGRTDAPFGPALPGVFGTILTSPHWSLRAGGAVDGPASAERLIWVELAATRPPRSATAPNTTTTP